MALAGVPSGLPPFGVHTTPDAPHFPRPDSPPFLPFGQPAAMTLSAPAHSGMVGGTHPPMHSPVEKAIRTVAAPKLKRELPDEIRDEETDNAQRRRDRDVDDRVNLNIEHFARRHTSCSGSTGPGRGYEERCFMSVDPRCQSR